MGDRSRGLLLRKDWNELQPYSIHWTSSVTQEAKLNTEQQNIWGKGCRKQQQTGKSKPRSTQMRATLPWLIIVLFARLGNCRVLTTKIYRCLDSTRQWRQCGVCDSNTYCMTSMLKVFAKNCRSAIKVFMWIVRSKSDNHNIFLKEVKVNTSNKYWWTCEGSPPPSPIHQVRDHISEVLCSVPPVDFQRLVQTMWGLITVSVWVAFNHFYLFELHYRHNYVTDAMSGGCFENATKLCHPSEKQLGKRVRFHEVCWEEIKPRRQPSKQEHCVKDNKLVLHMLWKTDRNYGFGVFVKALAWNNKRVYKKVSSVFASVVQHGMNLTKY